MGRLGVEDLQKIKERVLREKALDGVEKRVRVTVHMGTCGVAAGAAGIMEALRTALKETGTGGVVVTTSGCAGLCSNEPMATVECFGQAPVKYAKLTPEKMRAIVEEHIIGGKPIKKLALVQGNETVC